MWTYDMMILSYQIINGSVEQHGCISSWPTIPDDLIKKLAWVFECPPNTLMSTYEVLGKNGLSGVQSKSRGFDQLWSFLISQPA